MKRIIHLLLLLLAVYPAQRQHGQDFDDWPKALLVCD